MVMFVNGGLIFYFVHCVMSCVICVADAQF